MAGYTIYKQVVDYKKQEKEEKRAKRWAGGADQRAADKAAADEAKAEEEARLKARKRRKETGEKGGTALTGPGGVENGTGTQTVLGS